LQEVHLGNPIFQSEMKGSSVIVTLHSPIHENFDTIDSNVTIIIQDYKERNKILESNLKVTGISKIPNPTTLHSSISSIQETKENQA